MDFNARYGPWALVTGAAQGMGAAFAVEAARRGCAVAVVDRDEAALAEQAASLRATGAVVREVVVNLADVGAADAVLAAVADLDVGLLISNAARAYVGPFLHQDLDEALGQLDVNCRAPLGLIHPIARRLAARGHGGIVMLASGSAWRGAPLVATYAATKAWTLILAESLWDELNEIGVDVLGVVPGSTRTPGWLASAPQAGLGTATIMEPAEVATEVLDGLGQGPTLIPGQSNREGEAFLSSLDRREAVSMMGQVMRAMYPSERRVDPTV